MNKKSVYLKNPKLCKKVIYEDSEVKLTKIWTWNINSVYCDKKLDVCKALLCGEYFNNGGKSTFVSYGGDRLIDLEFDYLGDYEDEIWLVGIQGQGYGFLNKILIRLHFIDIPVQWLSQRWTLLAVVALVAAWRNIPFCTVVYISAMQAIPDSVIEAAAIDGAGPWQRFQRITFPLLLPASGVVLTSTSISAVNVFDEIVSLAGYGDLGKTLLIQDYLTTFSFLDFGTGSALSYLIMILAGLLGLLYLKSIAREGEEV